MPPKQVRDVIDQVRKIHRDLAHRYGQLGHNTQNQRLILLVRFMGRHEAGLQRALASYGADGKKGVLDSWLKYVPDDDLMRQWKMLRIDGDMSVGELLGVALRFDSELTRFYQEMADAAHSPDVQAIFVDLYQLVAGKEKQYSFGVLELNDQ